MGLRYNFRFGGGYQGGATNQGGAGNRDGSGREDGDRQSYSAQATQSGPRTGTFANRSTDARERYMGLQGKTGKPDVSLAGADEGATTVQAGGLTFAPDDPFIAEKSNALDTTIFGRPRAGLDYLRDMLNPRNLLTAATGLPLALLSKLPFTGDASVFYDDDKKTDHSGGDAAEGLASIYTGPPALRAIEPVSSIVEEEVVDPRTAEMEAFRAILRRNLGLI